MQASSRAAAAPHEAPASAELAEQLLTLWRHVMTTGGSVGAYAIFEELDLTLTQVKALCVLANDELTVKEVGARLGLSLPGTSRAVDALVERGLLDRREDSIDRRMKRLRCTDAGRDALERLDEARLAGLERFAETLPATHARRLSAALRPIVDDITTRDDAR